MIFLADVTIGFDNSTYRVDENDGVVNVTIRVLNGSLKKEVILIVSTINSTAIRKIYSQFLNR